MYILSVFDRDGELVPVAASRHIHVIEEFKQKLRARRVNVASIDEYDTVPDVIDIGIDYPRVP